MKLSDIFDIHNPDDCQTVLNIYPYEVNLHNDIVRDLLETIFEDEHFTKTAYDKSDEKPLEHQDWWEYDGDWSIHCNGHTVYFRYHGINAVTQYKFNHVDNMKKFEHYIW